MKFREFRLLIMLAAGIVLFALSCTNSVSGDPVVPVPGPNDPDSTLQETIPFQNLLGNYLGACSRITTEFDWSNGETTTTWDSLDIEISVAKIELRPDQENYDVYIAGGYFPDVLFASLGDLEADSVNLGQHFGGSRVEILITPDDGKMKYDYQWYAPYGPDYRQVNCICWKE